MIRYTIAATLLLGALVLQVAPALAISGYNKGCVAFINTTGETLKIRIEVSGDNVGTWTIKAKAKLHPVDSRGADIVVDEDAVIYTSASDWTSSYKPERLRDKIHAAYVHLDGLCPETYGYAWGAIY